LKRIGLESMKKI